ncbi:MAG: DUF3891 family protein [Thermoanaerobaculales bacterium]|nr:DUF3891 family protein [Thermoanaerobaculales bacterium]
MFLYHEHNSSGPYAIAQSSHAWMAWQVSNHWGNRRFAKPAPRAEVGAAILLHDIGWADFDAAPDIDADGRPTTFDRMSVEQHLEIWRRSVSQTGNFSRYAATLVASHFATLAKGKTTELFAADDTTGARLVEVYRAEMERLQATWLEELSIDARYETTLKGNGRLANSLILSACDRISVVLSAEITTPFRSEVVGEGGELETVELTKIDERSFRMNPWPLEGDRLKVHCEGRHLRTARFDSKESLREALRRAPVERLAFTLLRPAAKS